MKTLTLKNVAEMVLNTEWDCDNDKKIVVIIESSDLPIYFGITVKDIFDCEYLILDVLGGGFIRCYNWDKLADECFDREDMIDEVVRILEEFFFDWYGNQSYKIAECRIE